MNILHTTRRTIPAVMLGLALAASCAIYDPDIRHGATYEDGSHPFDAPGPQAGFDAVGFVDVTGKPQLQLAADMLCGSLAFGFADSARLDMPPGRTGRYDPCPPVLQLQGRLENRPRDAIYPAWAAIFCSF
jgi:hypothetical protein